jgi:hypothetical protein
MKLLSLTRNSSQLTQSTRRAMSARARSISVQCSRKWDSKFVTTSCRITFDTYRPTCGGDEKLPICSTGDVDTVPLGVSPRGQDAFAGETHGDKLYGRGTSDMKSGRGGDDCHGASTGEDFASKSRDDAHLHGGRRDHLRGRLCRDCKSLVWSLGNKEPKYDDD